MPWYDYKCNECGCVFEVMQNITAKPEKKMMCVNCKQVTSVTRLIGSGGAVLFKGSGFYQTDYRSEKYKKEKKEAETKKENNNNDPKKRNC